jgi:hypothetical protein
MANVGYVMLALLPLALTGTILNESVSFTSAYAQATSSNGVETWTDKENGVAILLQINPLNPVVDQPTQLKFSVQDLQTGKPIGDITAHITVTDPQSRIFTFKNITSPDGNFAVQYIFPDCETWQVIATVHSGSSSSKEFADVASFPVFVPSQPACSTFSITSSNTTSSGTDILNAIPFAAIAGGAAVAIFFIVRKRKRTERNAGFAGP